MNKLMFECHRLMNEAEGTEGEDGGGSAFSQKTGDAGGEGGDTSGEGDSAGAEDDSAGGEGDSTDGEGGGTGESAFAAKTNKNGDGEGQKDPTLEELAAMSDEDWAKGVLPDDKDREGHEIDRTFMTQMAKVCREAGISPRQMQAMSGRFQELAMAEQKRRDDVVAEERKQLDAANEAAKNAALEKFSDKQWDDIRAAAKKYVPAGSELSRLMCGPLGSNVELLEILNVVGKSLRGAAPGATGAAGSGENDAGMAVLRKTVPERYLR